MNPKTLKVVAIGYLIKSLLLGIAWLTVPDLPQKAMTTARDAWSRLSGQSAPRR